MKVGTKAITTIMESNAGEMTLMSRPTSRIPNFTRPRVFLSVPSPAASRIGIPVSQDASVDPPSLPTVATSIINLQQVHISTPSPALYWCAALGACFFALIAWTMG